DNGKFKYLPGSSYEYAFDSILSVGLTSGAVSEADDTSLKITGSAKLFAEGNCGYTLQVGAVKVINTKESVEKNFVNNIQKPVYFTLVNGQLEPEICTDASDSTYSLNIKRAIISLLQSGTESQDVVNEVDVFGQCPTHTSISRSTNGVALTKVRNLNHCAYRDHINSGLVSGVVNNRAGVTSSSLIQSDYSKELKIESGIIVYVQLSELYKFAGTTKGNLDINAKVSTTLKIKNADGTPERGPTNGNHVASIMFQKTDLYSSKNIAALKSVLSDLVDLTNEYVKKDSAKKFVELIRLMRQSDTETLLELNAFPHPNKVQAHKVYLDALFRTNTAESAKAILKQLPKLAKYEKILAILSLNMVETVDKETLNQAAAQLSAVAPKELYLVVGSLVTKYCARHGCHPSDVDGISKKYADSLKHCKPNTKKEEERFVYILKGIGNAQDLANNVVTALSECAAPSNGRSNRIRVAALQAFSGVACNPTLGTRALELLKDQSEDSELRIEAYLAAITCPSAELANQISDIVNSEKVYQVGGFIESSLRSIRDSTDVAREQQKYHFENIRVTKNFPKDYRRYSFNNELSYKLDALGISASLDQKLIYSQHGFLPRSARLNVTTELFGTNFNVIEASMRQENLENILEYYLGPKGLLNKDFDEIVKLIEVGNSAGSVPGSRAKRSIADDSDKTSKKYKTYGSKNVQDLNLDLSLKLFGSELVFLSLGDNIPATLDDIIIHFSTAFDKAKKELSSFEKQFNFNSLFIDSSIAYPTGAGIPLEFAAQGFAANKIDFAVNVDVNAILEQNWQKAKYRLKMVPSTDVNVNMQLSFNAHVLASGIRLVTTGHSATGSDISISLINEGDGFNVGVELPREKLEIIDVQVNTEFFVAEQDKPLKVVLPKAPRKQKNIQPSEFCFNQLNIVGINVCVVSSTAISNIGSGAVNGNRKPNALLDGIHLSRPLHFAVHMTTERKFNFKGTHSILQSGSQQWRLDYSTPGSKVSHDTSVAFELGTKPRTYGRLSLDNPQYHLGVEAGINNDSNELVLYGQYEQDKDVKKSKIGFTKHGNEYKPLIEIQDKNGVTNTINGYRADGKIVVQQTGEKQSRYNFQNFQIVNQNNERIMLNGWADVSPSSLITQLHISPGKQTYQVKTNFKLENGHHEIGLFVNDERSPENIYGGSAQMNVNHQAYKLKLSGKAVTWSIDSSTEFEFQKADNTNEMSSGKLSHNIKVEQKNKPFIAGKIITIFDVNKFQFDAEAVRDIKIASVNIKYQANQKSVRDYDLVATAKLNKHSIDLLLKCDTNGNMLVVDNSLTTSWGTVLTAKGNLGQRYTPQDVHIDLQGSAQFSGKEKPVQWTLKVLGTPEKTNSELHFHRDNVELVKITSESQHPQDKITSAKIILMVKNLINAKTDFKVAKNGKGELTASIETLKTEPKHKLEIDTKFHIQTPKYDIDAIAILDGKKKIHFKTESNVEKLKFSTKNILEANEKKMSFEASGNVKGEWRTNGDIQGTFTLTTIDGRVIDGSINRHWSTNPKTHLTQGTVDVQINDQEPEQKKKRSLTVNTKLDRTNLKTHEYSANTQISYTDFNNQKSELKNNMAYLIKGNSKSFEFGIKANSNLIPHPLDVTFVVDEYSGNHAIGRISAKYGAIVDVNLSGNYQTGHDSAPASYELQCNLQLPETKLKNIELSSHGKFIKPTDSSNNYNVEATLNTKTGAGQFAHINTAWTGTTNQGSYSLNAQTNEMTSPFKLDGSYQSEKLTSSKDSDANSKLKFTLNAQYGAKFIKSNFDASYAGVDTATLHYSLDSSFESVKDILFEIRSYKSAEESSNISVLVNHAGKSYNLISMLYGGSHKKGIEVRIIMPAQQPIVFMGIVEILGERKMKLTLNFDFLSDMDFKLSSELAYTSIDEFYCISDWSSKKFQQKSYHLEVKAQTKNIKVQLKDSHNVILTGSATYGLKKEQNKSIIEGQGQVQYKGKTHSGNFKLTRQQFNLNIEKEVGFAYTLNVNFGSKNGVSTLKLTNKEFNSKISICEEKQQCTNIQLQSTVNVDEQHSNAVQHAVLILIDLRELGYPYEFELKSKSQRHGFKQQYSLDSHVVSGQNNKYQLSINLTPSSSILKVTLPKREILFESTQKLPTDGKIFGHYEQSAAFYIDKVQRPNEVTRFSAIMDITGVEKVALNAQCYLKIEHPTIRPLSIEAKIDANGEQHNLKSEIIFDIFRVADQKVILSNELSNAAVKNGFNITSVQQVHSSGLQLQYKLNSHAAFNGETRDLSGATELRSSANNIIAGASVFGNKDRMEILISGLNEQILHVTGNINWQKRVAVMNSKMQVFGQKPMEILTEIQPNWAMISLKREPLIDANAEVKLGKEFKFDAVGNGKPLINGRIALDAANFLQTSYKTNDEDITSFLNAADVEFKKEMDDIAALTKARFEKLRHDLNEQVKLVQSSAPDLTKLKLSYDDQMKSIVKELESDPSLKPIIDAINTLVEKYKTVVDEVTKSVSEVYEKMHSNFKEMYEKLQDLWKDSLLKIWEQLMITLTKLIEQLRIELVNTYTKGFKSFITWLEHYGPALKNYGKAINESMKPINEAVQELIKVTVHALEEFNNEIKEYIAKMPTFDSICEEFKNKLHQLKLADNIIELLNSMFEQLHILPQTPESNELLQKLHEYLQAKLKQQQVNDEKWLDELAYLLLKAIRAISASIDMRTPNVIDNTGFPGTDVQSWFSSLPHTIDAFRKLPALLTFRSSIINWILNENWEKIFSRQTLSWVFFQNFELNGHIVNGQHVFTFDGQHYAYPGSCKYILAQDSVDNNFTVIAQLNNGKLKGITLVDRDGNFMEVSDTMALKVNGKAVEYPQYLPGFHAWRRYYTVHLLSEYGVAVMCTTDLKVCHVNVNGFYTSKTRGLLGNGNGEPYDDYLLINGSLASNYADLGNDYGLGKCNMVTYKPTVEDNQSRQEVCSEIFGMKSPLALNYLTLDSRPYREACDITVQQTAEKDKESEACIFALAYGSALKQLNQWVMLPTRCLKCPGPAGQRDFGDEFIVKTPTNKADVVFVVDINVTPAVLSQLVAPAINELRESLKTRGFTDVQIGVIAYDKSKKYPALLTSENGKINYKGNVANIQLNGPKNFCDNCMEQIITEKRLLEFYNLIERFVNSIAPQSDEKAFQLSLDYPFRAGAAKSIIAVRSDTLEYNNWWKFVRAQITGTITKFDGALLHMIAPVKDLALEGVTAEKLIGFNSRLVATLDGKDNKKRSKLQFENDMGIDFVLNSGGWVFATQNFGKLKAADQKKALGQVTSSIADTLFKTETVNDCRCMPVHGVHGQHKCSIKTSNFIPNKKPKAA
ncbi:Rfabg, partial [Drosophila busckii]